MVLFLRGSWIVYRKLEKPYLWHGSKYSDQREYITHLGKEQFFASYYGLEGIPRIGTTCWGLEGNENAFDEGAVVAPSPIILWEE
jgi:hypothetical protein